MTANEVRRLLPSVGDTRMETKSIFCDEKYRPDLHKNIAQPCTVVEVNAKHFWYRVEFSDGMSECYKFPDGEAYK